MREKVFRKSSGFRFNVSFVECTSVFVKSVQTSLSVSPGGGGYSHTVPIRVCAAHVRGRDFEAPDLERGIHFRGVF